MLRVWEEREARADRRSAMAAYVLAEIHRDRRHRSQAFALQDFMPHRWPLDRAQTARKPRQTADEQRDVLMAFVKAMGGVPEGESTK